MIALRKCTEFFTLNELWEIAYLNKFFYRHFMNIEVSSFVGLQLVEKHCHQTATQDNFKQIIHDLTGITIESISQIPAVFKYATNLIKNPYGKYGYDGWDKGNRGQGWNIESSLTYNNFPSCFASSYEWGSLSITIELPKYSSKRKLFVGSPVARRRDCGSTAKLEVQIKDSNEQMKKHNIEVIPNFHEGNKYELMSICIDLEEDDLLAKVIFSGKDHNWWSGYYGARFGYCFAKILVC